MDTGALIVVLLLFVLVVGVNGGLFLMMRRRGGSEGDSFQTWRRLGNSVRRNPWEEEDKNLEELSKRVKELKGGKGE